MKEKEIDIKKLEKIIAKDSIKLYTELIHWLYINHKDVLREFEATKGTLRIEFLGEENNTFPTLKGLGIQRARD